MVLSRSKITAMASQPLREVSESSQQSLGRLPSLAARGINNCAILEITEPFFQASKSFEADLTFTL